MHFFFSRILLLLYVTANSKLYFKSRCRPNEKQKLSALILVFQCALRSILRACLTHFKTFIWNAFLQQILPEEWSQKQLYAQSLWSSY